MGKLRFFLALWAGKCAYYALRALGRRATYLPGKIAARLCPDLLARIQKPARVVVVTGSNGKTTVSNMLGDVLTGAGRRVLSNRLGSNVQAGVASCLLGGVTVFGKAKFDIAILEMDERSSLKILPFVKPDFMAVTNLFRDSIMRNAHPAYIAGFLDAVPKTTKLILNADDPISSRVAPGNPRAYFGVERMDADVTD
ncbi:MAG: Mur ligase family protein, partial [Oscillospiraceae bacterium]|nr:Mur ligase family protein [Oscillospiraceae bacterium]